MPVTVFLGEQRGDEGKGRFVDMYMQWHDIGVRFNGGPNAGHTIVMPNGEEYDVHALPSSILHDHATSVIGNGTVVNPEILAKEITTFRERGIYISEHNLLLSATAHLILPHHKIRDANFEKNGSKAQGSTLSGIAPAYADKYARVGLQVGMARKNPALVEEVAYEGLRQVRGSLTRHARLHAGKDRRTARDYAHFARRIAPFITDTSDFLNTSLAAGKHVLAEGAQGFLLDIDHGMYPYVSSSSATIGGVITGTGIAREDINQVIGVCKAIQSHVGKGPFVTEETDPDRLARLHGDMTSVDAERGTTTGRTRRLGYLDLAQIRRAQQTNGTDQMGLTKFDWLVEERVGEYVPIGNGYLRKGKLRRDAPDTGDKYEESTPQYEYLPSMKEDIQNVRHYKDLPPEGKNIIQFLEEQTGVPITLIGVGPGRDQVIVRDGKNVLAKANR